MRDTIRNWALAAALLGTMAVASGRADGGMITFTQATTASGSLGGVAFTDAAVTFIQAADTGSITGRFPDPLQVVALSSIVLIEGLGVATFSTPTSTFSLGSYAGVGRSSDTQVIIACLNPPAFFGYGLGGPIGPVVGPALINPANAFATDRGSLVLTSARAVTFRATAGAVAVPEPGSLALCGLAAVAGLVARSLRNASVA